MDIGLLVVILALLALSAYFSGTETGTALSSWVHPEFGPQPLGGSLGQSGRVKFSKETVISVKPADALPRSPLPPDWVARATPNPQKQAQTERFFQAVRSARRALADGDAALAAYEESLTIDRRLVEAEATNADRQRNLALSLYKVGTLQEARGRVPQAVRALREADVVHRRALALASAWGRIASGGARAWRDDTSRQGSTRSRRRG